MVFAFDVRCGLGGGGERFARPTLNGGSDLRDKVRNAPRADQTQFVDMGTPEGVQRFSAPGFTPTTTARERRCEKTPAGTSSGISRTSSSVRAS